MLLSIVICVFSGHMKTSQQYECIIDELFEKSEYNPLVRPVMEINETVTVQFSVQLSQIVDIVSTCTVF